MWTEIWFPLQILQDILKNDSIKLDWNFKYSLMSDIVKVIVFLYVCYFAV